MLDIFYKQGFVFEILLASILFVHSLKRRSYFWLRIIAAVVLFLLVAILWEMLIPKNIILDITKYTVLFFITVMGVFFCFETTIWVAAFCEIGAYATEHIIYKLSLMFLMLIGDTFFYLPIYLLTLIIVYAAAYFVFASKIKRNEAVYLENRQISLLGIALILFIISFQIISEKHLTKLPFEIYIVMLCYSVFCCIFTLCIQYGMFKSGKLQQDNKLMEQILHMQKRQLKVSKDNIEMINIKCHDLKHQISRLGDRISPRELDELRDIISIYDSSLKTGNEALNIILAEKSLYCEQKSIRISCLVDGEALSFMKSSDIYSLFGNALDNAIEAVDKLADKDKRIISLKVKKSLNMVSVNVENYFVGNLDMAEGLPTTTKKDKHYHGYGMRSIRMITEKYRGSFSFLQANNRFSLNLLFPL